MGGGQARGGLARDADRLAGEEHQSGQHQAHQEGCHPEQLEKCFARAYGRYRCVNKTNIKLYMHKWMYFLAGIFLAQKMTPEKRVEFVEAIENIGDREGKSVSPSPSNVSEGEGSP